MSLAKTLTEEQIATIRGWAEDGAAMPEIQRRLGEELEIRITYMETRFLLGDLDIHLKEEEKPAAEPDEAPEDGSEEESDSEAGETEKAVDDDGGDVPEAGEEDADGGGGSDVTVTISELERPGTMVSGRMTFANGEAGDWWMDQFGRLGMDVDNKEFRPTEADMMSFQKELQKKAKEKGL